MNENNNNNNSNTGFNSSNRTQGNNNNNRNNNSSGGGRSSNRSSNNNRSNRSNRSNNSERRTKGATEELGYNVFDCTSRKQIEACNETIKQIAIYVGKEYGKNADLIKFVVEHEKDPDLEEPEDITNEEQKNRLKMFKWQESVKRYLDRQEGLSTGKKKLYTLIWGQCTRVMQNELEAMSDYETMNEDQDPIKLLKNIKSITYNFRDQKYLSGSMWRAYKTLYNTNQKEEEDLKTYYDRFKNQVKVIENYGGTIGTDFNLYEQEAVW